MFDTATPWAQNNWLAGTATSWTHSGQHAVTSSFWRSVSVSTASTVGPAHYTYGNALQAEPNYRNHVNSPPVHRPLIAPGAEDRAMKLLFSCLNEEQREMMRAHKKFRVVSNKGNIFEIRHGRMHNIFRLDLQGHAIEEWCVLPQGELAPGDVMLAQKMCLETDEDDLASHANITVLANGHLRYRAPRQYMAGQFLPSYN